MQFNIPTASLLILVSAAISVHTSPVPSNNVALIGRANCDSSVNTRHVDVDIVKRQQGGKGAGGKAAAVSFSIITIIFVRHHGITHHRLQKATMVPHRFVFLFQQYLMSPCTDNCRLGKEMPKELP